MRKGWEWVLRCVSPLQRQTIKGDKSSYYPSNSLIHLL